MPEGAALVCRPITCPAIDPHDHPFAGLVVPAPSPETHRVMNFVDLSINFTVRCAPELLRPLPVKEFKVSSFER